MDSVTVTFKKLVPHAVAPAVQQEGDVAADLFAAEDTLIPARNRKLVSTGIALELPIGFRASIRSRSGLSLKAGIEAGAGLIDQGYRREIGVLLYNHSDADYEILKGDRIAQICIERFTHPCFVAAEEINATPRSEGWGSSGR